MRVTACSRPSGASQTNWLGRVIPLRTAYSPSAARVRSRYSVKRRGTALTGVAGRKGPRAASSASQARCRLSQTAEKASRKRRPVASRTVLSQLKRATPPWSATR